MNSEEAEVIERNRKMGITVRRAPINYVGPSIFDSPAKKKTPRNKYAGESAEDKKKRLSNAAKEWYHSKVAADPSYKEKRRQDAKKWPKKKPVE